MISGDERFDNNGSHFQVTLGPSLELPPSDTVYGQIFYEENTPAEGVIVYITLQDNDNLGSPGISSLVSALVDKDGYWYTNLGNVRTPDLGSYFQYSLSGDSLRLQVYSNDSKPLTTTIDTAHDAPAETLFVDK